MFMIDIICISIGEFYFRNYTLKNDILNQMSIYVRKINNFLLLLELFVENGDP